MIQEKKNELTCDVIAPKILPAISFGKKVEDRKSKIEGKNQYPRGSECKHSQHKLKSSSNHETQILILPSSNLVIIQSGKKGVTATKNTCETEMGRIVYIRQMKTEVNAHRNPIWIFLPNPCSLSTPFLCVSKTLKDSNI